MLATEQKWEECKNQPCVCHIGARLMALLPRVPVLCFSRNLTSSKQYCVNEPIRQFSDTCPLVVATEIKLWCDCSMTLAQACITWLQISNFVSVRDWFAALLSQRKPGWRGQATWRSLCTHMYGRCKFTYSYNLLKVPPLFPKAYCFHGLFLRPDNKATFCNHRESPDNFNFSNCS